MQQSYPFRLLLAATLSLGVMAGCAPTGMNVLPISAVSAPQALTAQDAQTAAQIQRDMDDLELLGEMESGFATMAIGIPQTNDPDMVSATAIGIPQTDDPDQASATAIGIPQTQDPDKASATGKARLGRKVELRAEVRAAAKALNARQKDAIKQKAQEARQKAAARLQPAHAAFKKGMEREVTVNEFGGKTHTMVFDYTLPNGALRKGSMERVYNADGILVSSVQVQDWTAKNGRTRHMERTKDLQADGSYLIKGSATDSFRDKLHQHTWEKTISADGQVTGTGTVTRPDGTTVQLAFGGTTQRETVAVTDKATDTRAVVEAAVETGVSASVALTDTNATVQVAVSDGDDAS